MKQNREKTTDRLHAVGPELLCLRCWLGGQEAVRAELSRCEPQRLHLAQDALWFELISPLGHLGHSPRDRSCRDTSLEGRKRHRVAALSRAPEIAGCARCMGPPYLGSRCGHRIARVRWTPSLTRPHGLSMLCYDMLTFSYSNASVAVLGRNMLLHWLGFDRSEAEPPGSAVRGRHLCDFDCLQRCAPCRGDR